MNRITRGLIAALALAAAPGTEARAQEQTADDAVRVYAAGRDEVLASARPNATRAAVLDGFLRSRGASRATVRSLRRTGRHRSPQTGVVHLGFEQEVAGLRVHDAYVRAAFDRRGNLIHVIESVAAVPAAEPRQARMDEHEALLVAIRALHPNVQGPFAVTARDGNTVAFDRRGAFRDSPRVERVLIPRDGGLEPGFLVETWGDQLHETLVDDGGEVLGVDLRTSRDSYYVFPDHPENSAQTVMAGPGAGNAESPAGWLFAGAQSSMHIAGNNAQVWADSDSDDAPDEGGTEIADGNFLAPADLTAPPSAPTNREVAVQNVFYLGSLIHDTLYRHGFTESAGNFQQSNFGGGGRGGDPLIAEVQDGALMNNAWISVPRDGRSPHLQLYLFSTGQLTVHAPASIAGEYYIERAEFGPPLGATGVTGYVALADDGVGTFTDACEPITNAVAGSIALVDRGNCPFTVKVKNAQDAGAIAAIVANNDGEGVIRMLGTDPTITIPSASVGQTDGAMLRSVPGVHVTIRLVEPSPRDSALDSDLVWHEYGHGLTWRMIDGMSGLLASAVGEGMSDVLAIVMNEDDALAEYSGGLAQGLRRARYAGYPRTYADVDGHEEHDDGEVYGAIGWRLFEIFQREGLGKELLLDYLVDGMNYTRRRPAFEHMRDGILAAVAAAGGGHECLVWEAFAQYGVGVGARGQVRRDRIVITESFAVPAECAP